MFSDTLYLNREWGELIFVTPWSNIYVVYESLCAEKPLCSVIEVDSLKRELLQSLIVNHEYTYIEEVTSLKHFFCFALFFSASKSKREVERQVQHIFCKSIKLKINKTKSMNHLIHLK